MLGRPKHAQPIAEMTPVSGAQRLRRSGGGRPMSCSVRTRVATGLTAALLCTLAADGNRVRRPHGDRQPSIQGDAVATTSQPKVGARSSVLRSHVGDGPSSASRKRTLLALVDSGLS